MQQQHQKPWDLSLLQGRCFTAKDELVVEGHLASSRTDESGKLYPAGSWMPLKRLTVAEYVRGFNMVTTYVGAFRTRPARARRKP